MKKGGHDETLQLHKDTDSCMKPVLLQRSLPVFIVLDERMAIACFRLNLHAYAKG